MSINRSLAALVDTIKRTYQLTDDVLVKELASRNSSTDSRSKVFLLETAERAYVLREYRTEDEDVIELHNSFLNFARDCNLDFVQQIVPSADGALSFACEGKRYWLAEFIAADKQFDCMRPVWADADCVDAGKILAQLHSALRAFARSEPDFYLRASTRGSAVTDLERKLSDAISENQLADSNSVALLSDNRSRFLEILGSANSTIANSNCARDVQLVHGDYHPGNVLYRNGAAVAVVDFEYLNCESAIYDVAYALVMFGTDLNGGFSKSKISALLRAYEDASTEVQRDLLSAHMIVAATVCFTWYIKETADSNAISRFGNVILNVEKFDQ